MKEFQGAEEAYEKLKKKKKKTSSKVNQNPLKEKKATHSKDVKAWEKMHTEAKKGTSW